MRAVQLTDRTVDEIEEDADDIGDVVLFAVRLAGPHKVLFFLQLGGWGALIQMLRHIQSSTIYDK